jgi:PKD repeat protein
MKKVLALLLLVAAAAPAFGYPKVALVERFTNASCAPCASLNAAWYSDTSQNLEDQGYLNHIVYHVNWPGPLDPMYLVNPVDNMIRRGFYGVNSVPWVEIDGTTFTISGNTAADQANFTNIVNSTYSTGYAPFQIEMEPKIYAGNVIDVQVTITRDPADTTVLPATVTLQLGLLENVVTFASPPGSNGERVFPDVCRKMLDDAHGTAIPVPAPGESFTTSLLYIPSAEAQGAIDFSQARIIAFLQHPQTQVVYQSKKAATVFTDSIHAAFRAAETVGAAPLVVAFEDLSSPQSTRPITDWRWDLNGDGTVDSTAPEPVWTYPSGGTYTVTLTVSDGLNSHTTTRENYVYAVTNQSDILVVNGIEYQTYLAEMTSFYATSAIFGAHQVDVWDLFGDQGFDYLANPSITQVVEMTRKVPTSVLNLYRTVIWVGNNYSGDVDYFDGAQVLDYVTNGGNFILATRMGSTFLTTALRTYCGITSVTADRTVTQLVAQDANLVNMNSVGANSLVHLVQLAPASEAVTIFKDPTAPTLAAGFRIRKEGDGTFIYVAGRPYRFETGPSYQNYGYMLDNWTGNITAIDDDEPDLLARPFGLTQNQPNPFNPSTQIRFSLAHAGHVSLKLYDAAGRCVRTLVDDTRSAAEHTVTWDGRDDAGATVAAGVYLYRLQTDDESQTRRMVLVK